MRQMRSVFSRNLRTLRERKGISRRVLSELCGLSKNMIARYERGEQIPTCDALSALAGFFGVPMDELWSREE